MAQAASGYWVRRTYPAPAARVHTCGPPNKANPAGQIPTAEGNDGDVWRCGCGRLWEILLMKGVPSANGGFVAERKVWQPAAWRTIRAYQFW